MQYPTKTPSTKLHQKPDKALNEESSTKLGFALLDADGKILSANADFTGLLNISIEDTRLSLAEKLITSFSKDTTSLGQALQNKDSCTLSINSNSGISLLLHIAELENERRIVVVEKSANNKVDLEDYHDSLLDPLTQLGNRRLLETTLSNWTPSDTEKSLALIMIDLDGFKSVNDTLGHGIGDSLLNMVAKRVKRAARADDIVMRLGGDEFVILQVIGDQPSGAERIAENLVKLIARPFLVDGHQINIGASAGIAEQGKNTECVDDLLRHADLAMYDAKSAGRGTYRFFDPRLETKAKKRREVEISLRRALGLKQFSLVYQPQVRMPNAEITGFEALIRWNHPELGMIPPDQFISLAEEIGEIIPIGKWVLQEACSEAVKWPSHYSVAVNVSPVQFESKDFVQSIDDALKLSGLAPDRLEVEITENLLIKKPELVLEHLHSLKDIGVSIAMDDFGTGYSSLSCLSSFPFSKIKIDQAFVRGEQTDKSLALINAIISLGASLGMNTLAEGVETEDQFNHLVTHGCMEAQGYLISRPIPPHDIDNFILSHLTKDNSADH